MNHWHYFLWLCEQAADFIVFPPVLIGSFLFGVIVAGLCAVQHPIKKGLWKKSYWYVFTQLLFYPAVLVVAAVGAREPHTQAPNVVASVSATVLSWTSLALAGFWVWRMKGLRWLAVSLMILQEFLVYGAFLVAEMAISGRWL